MLATARLQPFHFAASSHAYGWIPFAEFRHTSRTVELRAFCSKSFRYGGLVWLCSCAGLRLRVSTLVIAMMLLVTSFAQRWLPGGPANITGPAMTLGLGVAFALLRRLGGAGRSERDCTL